MLISGISHAFTANRPRNNLVESTMEKSNAGSVLLRNLRQGEEKRFEPQVMCFTQEAVAIYALEMGPYNERECLIGVSQSGSVFVWSLTDGQCQVSKTNGAYFNSTPPYLPFPSKIY